MRDYGKVSPKFWIGPTGKALRLQGHLAQLVALYLMTSPHANMLGLYYLPKTFIAHETGLGFEGASKGLAGCIEAGFCRYDDISEIVWVMEMARFQIAEELKEKDLRVKGVQSEYDSLPENPFLTAFFDMYEHAFLMSSRRASSSPFEAPSKPLRSQEQEQEQEQDQKQEQNPSGATAPDGSAIVIVAETGLPDRRKQYRASENVNAVFDYWKQAMGHQRAKIDAKRAKAIGARLADGYTVEDLCRAVDGCRLSPHHMGKNETQTVYDDIELICRDGSRVDKFIALTARTGQRMNPGLAQQVDILNEWMREGD